MIVLWWLGACGPSDPAGGGDFGVDSQADDSAPPPPDDSTADDPGTADQDGDGWIEPDDCDDGDPSVYPDAPEACVDHRDNDCDGVVDHCDLVRDTHLLQRLVDPDADRHDAYTGFGLSMGFLDVENAGLWISPQGAADDPIWRKATLGGWSSAEVSGFQTLDVDHTWHSMVETDGDFDLDGARDLVLAEGTDEGVTAYLFYSPIVATQARDTADATVAADGTSLYGRSAHVRAMGDQTGDGADDLFIGDFETSWIVSGPITGDVQVVHDPGSRKVEAAWSATGLDFDADGIRDLAVSSPFDPLDGSPSVGGVALYLGPAPEPLETTLADCEWHGAKRGILVEQAGSAADSGDLDGDGRDELIVRSWGYHLETQRGAVYVVDQTAPDDGELSAVARAQIEGNDLDHLGETSGEVADFDHDERSDLVVSTFRMNDWIGPEGYVALFLGPLDGRLDGDTDANLTLRGSEDDWAPGLSTVAADLDGDGELELAMGCMVYDEDDNLVSVVDMLTPALLFAP